ncbi:hypothetical protein EV426DRAFT_705713 [Tirmania nivea]|nr:hypothetical protein EV426DRAFT_705713 [Tirmania nivea]
MATTEITERPRTVGDLAAHIFQDDTVALKSNPKVIGVATMTWHEHQEGSFEDTDEVEAGEGVTEEAMNAFMINGGQPPPHHLVFQPASAEYSLLLVRESDVNLLDRALAFGDVVKRSPTDAISGTIINVGLTANIVHCFQETELRPVDETRPAEEGNKEACAMRPNEQIGSSTATIRDVLDEELKLAIEWEEGAFVIWKNCWLGMIERVDYKVAIRLSNGSVVVPEDCSSLEVPVGTPNDGPRAGQNTPTRPRSASNRNRNQTMPTSTTINPSDSQSIAPPARIGSVPAPAMLTVGQQIITKKGNLRRGHWIFGSYNPSIQPIGTVVDVEVAFMGINWCCQNIAVKEFVAVPSPPSWLEPSEIIHLQKFKTSTRGLRTPSTGFGPANIAVGDKVRFKNLDEAVKRYDGTAGKGRVYKIPRRESLGYDVNTFMVELTQTWVEVQWQDLSVSKHLAKDLTQYPNVDEHELWPGEVVIVKNDIGEDPAIASPPPPRTNNTQQPNDLRDQMEDGSSEPPAEVVIPKAVGVVQKADAKERVAKVRWFKNPQMELAGTFLVPGSHTGSLKEEVEEVSFYEVVAHQALGIRRGDFVILLPENKPSLELVETTGSTEPQEPAGSVIQSMSRQFGFFRNMMASSPSATLQSISNFITGTLGATPSLNVPRRANASEHLDFMNEPTDWFGEVVDLGLDGLVTVRLGALEEPRDVRLPIERLTVIFSEPADIDGWASDDEGSTDDDYDSQEEEEDDDEYQIWDDPMGEEIVTYEDGERINNDGGDKAWLTDSEDEMDVDVRSLRAQSAMGQYGHIMSDPIDSEGEELPRDSVRLSTATPKEPTASHTTLPSRQSQPEPEAFTIPDGAEKPPGFAILDDSIPADHAFGNTPPTTMDSAILRRVNREHNILQTSLPEGILVRAWESRLDLLRVLIIGPRNTPYELAPFVFDFHLGPDFPAGPPKGHFHSWTGGVGRVNPNLYEEGKICLSLLGTWHAQSYSEGWTVGSSVLQLLVSLMGLVLVKEPYYNEAGFSIYQNTPEAHLNSLLYSEKAYILARGFIKRVLTRPVSGFEEEIRWLYLPSYEKRGGLGLLRKVVAGMKSVVWRSERRVDDSREVDVGAEVGTEGVGRVSAGALVLLRRNLGALEEILAGDFKSWEGEEQ